MKVFLGGREAPVAGSPKTVGALLAALGCSRETHVVLRDGEPLTEDRPIGPDDQLEIVRVVSGG